MNTRQWSWSCWGHFVQAASHPLTRQQCLSSCWRATFFYSVRVCPLPELPRQARERFNDIEAKFRAATGYGFDALTESEARYLAKHDNAQRVRDRIIEAGNKAGDAGDAGLLPKNSRSQGAAGGLSSESIGQIADTKKAPEIWRRIGDNPQPNRPISGAKKILTGR